MFSRSITAAIFILAFVCVAAGYQNAPTSSPALAGQTPEKPASRPLLAEDVYKNVQIFKGKEATRLLPAMKALTGLLGVGCSHCHVLKEWEKDDKPAKATARKHFDMLHFITEEQFHDNKVSCWTCHAGKPVPDTLPRNPENLAAANAFIKVPPDQKKTPAEQYFKNIQTLKGVPAGDFPGIMAYFATSLGVSCGHCHVQSAFEKDDKPTKAKARWMLGMVTNVMNKYYGGSGTFGCPTCHRGMNKPQLLPPGS